MSEQEANGRHEVFAKWIKEIGSEKTRQYIQERVVDQMDWYKGKSKDYKTKYHYWMTVSIIISGAIPVVSVLADGRIITKILIALLGAAVTSINAYLNLKNYKDEWVIYRSKREGLLSMLYLYFNHVGIFGKEISQEDRDAMLIEMCEKYFQQETKEWEDIKK